MLREIESHLEAEAAERSPAGGSSEDEARREALRLFGNMALVQEEVREAWGLRWLDRLWQDLRYAARGLRRNAGASLVIILSLALGIGANAAIFSVLNVVLLRPLPVTRPEQLYALDITASKFRWSGLQPGLQPVNPAARSTQRAAAAHWGPGRGP
jgi:hypothetical protein